MEKEKVAALIEDIVGLGNVKLDEPMKVHTSFKVGGPADILVTPHDHIQLGKILKLCKNEEIPLFVMGNGTNLIVGDKGIRGVVVKLCDNYSGFDVNADIIRAKAGAPLSRIADVALEYELSGMEFASGIPGTLGGAVAMNAGAYGGEMKDVVIKTLYMDGDGRIREVLGEQHQFGYRTSFIQKQAGIILESEIKLKKGNFAEIKERMAELALRRRDKQPVEMPSAGSIFKRPAGYYTGRLIEECGLKGYKIGGAQVSSKHCGFIVNTGDATAEDILRLISHIRGKVRERFGIELQTEVKIIGEQ